LKIVVISITPIFQWFVLDPIRKYLFAEIIERKDFAPRLGCKKLSFLQK
jgi:hypothetical protein